jgi:hypothetical protein
MQWKCFVLALHLEELIELLLAHDSIHQQGGNLQKLDLFEFRKYQIVAEIPLLIECPSEAYLP